MSFDWLADFEAKHFTESERRQLDSLESRRSLVTHYRDPERLRMTFVLGPPEDGGVLVIEWEDIVLNGTDWMAEQIDAFAASWKAKLTTASEQPG